MGRRLLAAAAAPGTRVRRWWAGGFAAIAVCAAVGGCYHAIPHASAARPPLWSVTWLAAGLASFCLGTGIAHALLQGRARAAAVALLGGRVVVYGVALAQRRDLSVARWDGAITLALLLALAVAVPRVRPWLLGVAGLSLAGAAVQLQGTRLADHPAFGPDDVFHLVEMAALWLLGEAGRRLCDAEVRGARGAGAGRC